MFGLNVKIRRKAMKLSQAQLAEKTGISRQTIALIESERFNPSLKVCMSIARALESTLDDLFWDEKYFDVGNGNIFALIDIGSTATKAMLLEKDDKGLFVIKAESYVPTTAVSGGNDVSRGVIDAMEELGGAYGRKLVQNNAPVIPIMATSSAGGGLQIIVFGVSSTDTGLVAEMTANGAGGVIIRTYTIDDEMPVVQRILNMKRVSADMVLFSGGVEGGNVISVIRLAEILSLSSPSAKHTGKLPVIYAGNSAAAETVKETLGDQFEVETVENIRPDLETMNMFPAKRRIREIFLEKVMERAPGYSRIKKWTSGNLMPTPAGVERILSLYGEHERKNIALADIGGATTDIYSNIIGEYSRTVAAHLGMSYSLGKILETEGVEKISLMTGMNSPYIREYVYSKMITPGYIPVKKNEIAVERALAVAGIREAWKQHMEMSFREKRVGFLEKLRDDKERDKFMSLLYMESEDKIFQLTDIDTYVGSGGVISHTGDEESIFLMLADAFLPSGISNIMYDRGFRSPHMGLFAAVDKEKAYEVYRDEVLKKVGMVVAPSGKYTKGRNVLKLTEIDDSISAQVRWGEVLYYPRGLKAKIIAEKGSEIYKNRKEIEVDTSLPLLIDCRGREKQYDGTMLSEHLRMFATDSDYEAAVEGADPVLEKNVEEELSISLPFRGIMHVKKGDIVECGQKIGTAMKMPPRIYIIDIRRRLKGIADNISSEEAAAGVVVKKGDKVTTGDIIFNGVIAGRREKVRSTISGVVKVIEETGMIVLEEELHYSREPMVIPVAELCGVRPRSVEGMLQYRKGDYVEKGVHLLSLTQSTLYMREYDRLKAPGPGIITSIDRKTGEVTIEYQNREVDFHAWARGKISSIHDETDLYLKAEGDKISGSIAFGKNIFGRLYEYKPGSWDREGAVGFYEGKLTLTIMEEAEKEGVAALIVSTIDAHDWAEFTGGELGLAVTGDEEIPYSILSLKGFGNGTCPEVIFSYLREKEGAVVSVKTATRIRAGGDRPFVLLYDTSH